MAFESKSFTNLAASFKMSPSLKYIASVLSLKSFKVLKQIPIPWLWAEPNFRGSQFALRFIFSRFFSWASACPFGKDAWLPHSVCFTFHVYKDTVDTVFRLEMPTTTHLWLKIDESSSVARQLVLHVSAFRLRVVRRTQCNVSPRCLEAIQSKKGRGSTLKCWKMPLPCTWNLPRGLVSKASLSH